jgi:DNA-binding MarR family transcriptional regulator
VSSRVARREGHVGGLLLEAQRRFNDELVGRLHRRGFTGIKPSHGAVFANIDAEGTRATELARRAGMTKQSMSELIADLESKGYVQRRPDPRDRRARVVVLTTAGKEVDRAADEIIGRIERAYAKRLGEGPFRELKSLLGRLNAG